MFAIAKSMVAMSPWLPGTTSRGVPWRLCGPEQLPAHARAALPPPRPYDPGRAGVRGGEDW